MNRTLTCALALLAGCATTAPPAGAPPPLIELTVAAPACTDDEVVAPPTGLIERRPRSGGAAAGALYALTEVLAARYAACGMHLERVLFEGETARVLVRDGTRASAGAAGSTFFERWVRDGAVWRLAPAQPRGTRSI